MISPKLIEYILYRTTLEFPIRQMAGLCFRTMYSHTLTDLDVDFYTDIGYKSPSSYPTDAGVREM